MVGATISSPNRGGGPRAKRGVEGHSASAPGMAGCPTTILQMVLLRYPGMTR